MATSGPKFNNGAGTKPAKGTFNGLPKNAANKKPAAKKDAGKDKKNPNGLPTLKYPGDLTVGTVDAPQITNDPFNFTDTTFDYGQVDAQSVSTDKITAGTVSADTLGNQFMTAADYAMVDPSKIAQEYGDINREQMGKNADLSSELALKYLDTELQGLKNFAPAAAALKRSQIAEDNTFNQSERDRQLAAGDPNLRTDLESQAARARAYAEGRVPDSIQDRALELTNRSRAADMAGAGGFGVRSSAARKASELMSAESRIQLSQYGDQALTSNIQNRSNLLLSPTQYSDAGSQIKVTPTQSGAQVAMGIASEANAGNITARDALSNLTQQEQYKTTNEQDTRKFNTGLAAERDLNQAKLNLDASTTNVGNQLQADTVSASNALNASQFNATSAQNAQQINAANAIQTQSTAMGIKSNETQANAQLAWNTKNSNAQRVFEASSINTSNALQVAESNRTMRFDIQKTNKNMIFQDQQARKASAEASARASAAEAGANARAAMSYNAQKESLAAAASQREIDLQLALADRAEATRRYEEAIKRGQSMQNSGAAGTTISRIPSYVSGINSTITAINSIRTSLGYGEETTTTTKNPISTYSPDAGRTVIGQNADGTNIYEY